MSKAWLMLAFLLTGCATTQQSPPESPFDARRHAIYIDQFGNIKEPNRPQKNGSIEALPATAQDDRTYVRNMVENFVKLRETNSALKFTVFVHGGLNTFENFWRRTNRYSEAMLNDGQYAVFVGWNSGPFSNYFDHLFRIRKGQRRPFLGPVSAPFVLIEDMARSIAHLPAAWYMSFMDPLAITIPVEVLEEKDYDYRRGRLDQLTFNVHSEGPYKGTGVGGTYATIINPVKLVTAPFVDGLGAGSWDSMLRRTDLVLSKAAAFEGELTSETPPDYADTAVTLLLKTIEHLSDDLRKQGKPPIHVNLIGHSMGTIIVNNILARHPRLHVDNVVFMGAAARVKDVENGVVPWLVRQDNSAQFFNLSLDPYREMSENTYFDLFPRGSLLHWIDNIFGEVNSFKDRTAGGWWNIIRTAEDVFPFDVRPRVHLTRFPIGKTHGPQKHGEFDDYYFWCDRFWMAQGEQVKFDDNKDSPSRIARKRGDCNTPTTPHAVTQPLRRALDAPRTFDAGTSPR